jgi:zinc protease
VSALARHVAVVACVAIGVTGTAVGASDPVVWSLDDATRLVLVEDHRVPLAQLVVEFPVGSWSAWSEGLGAEEAFEISLYDPAGELRRRADALAADLSISMGQMHSVIRVSCHRDDLDAVVALVADVVRNAELDLDWIDRREDERRLAWKASETSPGFVLAQAAARRLYEEGDPRRRPYEKPRRLEDDRDDLLAVRDAIVRVPGRVIGFAGAVTRDDAERLARGLLPEASDAAPDDLDPRLGPVTPVDELPETETVEMRRIAQVFFAYGRPDAPTRFDDDFPAFSIADHVLGGHFYSRLYRALRHEEGDTYGAGTIGGGQVYEQAYALTTYTNPANAPDAEAKLRATLATLHADGITQAERDAAIGYFEGRRAFAKQSPGQILGRRMWELRNGVDAGFLDAQVDAAAALSLEEIDAFVKRFFDPATFRMSRVAPR